MTAESLDLRLAPAALAAWLAAAAAIGWSVSTGLLVSAALVAVGAAAGATAGVTAGVASAVTGARAGRPPSAAVLVLFVAAAAAVAVASLRAAAVTMGPVSDLAAEGAQVSLVARVVADPVVRAGRFGPIVVVRVTVDEVTGRGATTDVATPVVVIADSSWAGVRLGQTIRASGRLGVADTPDIAATMYGDPEPVTIRGPSWVWRTADTVRSGVREAMARAPPDEQALVPALVDGEDSANLQTLAGDFQTSGLTHLLAVSGSNLTLMLSFTLLAARLAGVRAHGLTAVAITAVVFFVLLARPEPSVLRAAAMGLVGIAGLAVGGRRRGSRSLCLAVLVLVLVDPWLARSPGFVLSALATAGILAFGGPWRDALARWLPRWLAEAVAVPLAAQLACTPAVAAISGQVSLVAVAANIAAAPAVGPATVLGLVGGLVALVSPWVSHLVGLLAAGPSWWIVWVAHQAGVARGAAVGWPIGVVAIAALTVLCVIAAVGMCAVLRRRVPCLVVAVVTILGVVQPWGRLGWPPRDWLLAMCDVGQGDALAIHVAAGAAVVVDAGPDPRLVDRCLADLDVDDVPLVVLTHFHADHVDGLPGVLGGRQVGQIEVSPLAEPADGAAEVDRWAADAGVPVVSAVVGESRCVGAACWTTLGPTASTVHESSDPLNPDGSVPNNASIVMRVEIDGLTLLLAGDAEPEEQAAIISAGADLAADVVKVAHHGSSSQDPDFYARTGAAVALISVGADNDYGHPAPETVQLVESLGMRVYRTDIDGDVVLAEQDGRLVVVADG
jgi:competence protein ComEC